MPKTRQQRIAEERAGHAPSPPQVLTDKPRGSRRTREKMPSANSTVVEGSVVPSQPLLAPGPEAPRALVHVWVDENRYVYDPSHEFAIPSPRVPELVLFLNKLRDQASQNSVAGAFSSATQVTPSLSRRQLARGSPISYAEPQLSEPSTPVQPSAASTGIVSPFQETSPPLKSRASFAHIEQPFQQFCEATAPLSLAAHVRSPPEETGRSMAAHDPLPARTESSLEQTADSVKSNSRPARIEAALKRTAYPVQSTRIESQSVTPSHAVNTSDHGEILDKQTVSQKIPDQEIKEGTKLEQTRPMRKSESSRKRKTEASEAGPKKKRAVSRKQSAPPTFKWKLTPMPSDPEKVRALGLLSIFRKHRSLPSYTADGEVRYGNMEPSDDYLKAHDEAPANTDPNSSNGRTPQTTQASSSSARVIRPAYSVKRQFGFSPLTTISERSETTPPMQPARSQPRMRVPSRLFDRMNANKRKRGTSPEPTPNPKGKSDGVKFHGNAEEDEDEVAGQQPGKVRRTSHLQNFCSQGAANSVSSRPYTGQQSINSKPPVPITNKAGAFKVPSPGDSDWSESQSEDGGSSQVTPAPSSTIINPGPTSQPQFRATAYEDRLQRAPPAATFVQRTEENPTAAGQTFRAAIDSSPPATSRPRFTAFEDWLQTASPSVASALEGMDIDPNAAGAAFQRGLVNHTTM